MKMSVIKIKIDGNIHENKAGITVGEVISNVQGKKSGAIAALINGKEFDLSHIIKENCKIFQVLVIKKLSPGVIVEA